MAEKLSTRLRYLPVCITLTDDSPEVQREQARKPIFPIENHIIFPYWLLCLYSSQGIKYLSLETDNGNYIMSSRLLSYY